MDTEASNNPNKYQADRVEEIAAAANMEWFFDDKIVAYTLRSADEGILNAWTDAVANNLQNWPRSKPYLALHDISAPGCAIFYMVYAQYQILNVGINPDYRERAEAILRGHDHPARVAVHLSLSLSGRVTQRSTEVVDAIDPQPVEYKTFFNRDKALEWLREGMI